MIAQALAPRLLQSACQIKRAAEPRLNLIAKIGRGECVCPEVGALSRLGASKPCRAIAPDRSSVLARCELGAPVNGLGGSLALAIAGALTFGLIPTARAHVFPTTPDLSTLDGATGFRLDGVATNDFSGFAVSAAGDVNGDGIDDLLIGAAGTTVAETVRGGAV